MPEEAKMKEKKQSVTWWARASLELNEKLEALAKSENRSRGNMILVLVVEALKARGL